MKVLRTETKKLPVKLTDSEVIEQSMELAHTIQEIAEEEESQTALKSQMKAKLMELDAKQSRLASIVATRTDYRDVAVEIQGEEDGTAKEVRVDTGEVVLTRPMREDEKQLPLGEDPQ